jgi:purine-binding chemotaxis protein CheW
MSAPAAQKGPARHFLTFRLQDRLYALPATDVAEVIRIPPVARLPQSPAGLMGLTNLRGDVLPVASGRRLLGQDEPANLSSGRAIVMNGATPVAFTVDEVAELMAIDETMIETQSAKLSALPGEALSGAFPSPKGGQIVKLLDINALLRLAFVPQSRAHYRTQVATAFENAAVSDAANRKLVSFAVAEQEYALPLDIIQEIVSAQPLLTSVPHSDAAVLGVTSLRDRLLPLLSLRSLLGVDVAMQTGKEKVVVAKIQGNIVGLVVDEVRAIFAADESKMDPMPDVLAARSGGESRIAAIYRGGKGLVSILSTDKIFGDDVMQRLVAAQKSADQPVSATASETRQFLVFRLGDEEYGLPIAAVEEVARVPDKIARLPNTPKFLEGVVNVRGEVIPVVDQRKRFHMAPLATTTARRLIVVRTARHIAGLIVDSVSEVLRCSVDDMDVTPDLTGEATKLVMGVVNLDAQKRIVLLLDPEELLSRAEKGLLEKFSKQHTAPEKA